MNIIADHLKELFEDKIIEDFRKYIELNESSSCYVILSDYALNNKDKTNDVVSYSIVTCEELEYLSNKVKKTAKKDIKNTRSINPEFIKLLNRKTLFHINFLLGERKIFSKKGELSKDKMIESIQLSLNELSSSKRKDVQERKIKLQALESEISKKSSNLKLITEIIIISFLTAYIMFLLTKEANVTEIAWMSDRDKITEAYNQTVFTMCQQNHYALCVRNNVSTSKLKNMYYFPTEDGIFFTELVRIPDYIAGTLSDWNKLSPEVSKEKFVPILREVISDNNFCKLFNLSFSEGKMRCNEFKLHS